MLKKLGNRYTSTFSYMNMQFKIGSMLNFSKQVDFK